MRLFLFCLLPIIAVFGSEMDGFIPVWSWNKLAALKAAESKERVAGWSENVTVNWITQRVDHFNPADTRTFQQRYLKNEVLYKAGGPLVIFVGGEWSVEYTGMDLMLDPGSTTYDIAADNNGLLLYPEHRFYGESYPFNNTRLESLRYLNIDQTVEDLATFIRFIKSSDPRFANAKVILTGASFSGTLSSFFKTKYPTLADGAWPSSAPTEMRSETVEYRVLSGQAIIKYGGQQCYNKFQEGFLKIETLLEQRNVDQIESAFRLCDRINVDDWRSVMHFLNIVTSFMASHLTLSSPDGIVAFCDTVLKAEDPLLGVAEVFQFVLPVGCFYTDYQYYVDYLRNTELTHPANYNGILPWVYQTCTDVGLYQTSASPNQPFGRKVSLDIYLEFCKDVFGFETFTRSTLDASTRRINLMFGGLTPNIKQVFYTHGEIDPWKVTGIQQTLNPEAQVWTIPGAGHCYDIFVGMDDVPDIQIARNKVRDIVKQWLQ